MKTLFKKTLSALLAVLCFGGMFAAAADVSVAKEARTKKSTNMRRMHGRSRNSKKRFR